VLEASSARPQPLFPSCVECERWSRVEQQCHRISRESAGALESAFGGQRRGRP